MKTVSFKTVSKVSKTFILVLTLSTFSFALHAQSSKHKKKHQKTEQTELKDHVCTAACIKDHHVYAHGEKGHVCTKECKKMESSKMKNKQG